MDAIVSAEEEEEGATALRHFPEPLLWLAGFVSFFQNRNPSSLNSFVYFSRSGSRSNDKLLFEAHPMAVNFLVSNLIGLYVDVEYTGSHTQFYDKVGALSGPHTC